MQKRRKRNRLRPFDYSIDGLYFITSCVHNNTCCFGTVVGGEMILNQYGRIVKNKWCWLAKQYPYVRLHAFVVMPNHLHGILEISRKMMACNADQKGISEDAPPSSMRNSFYPESIIQKSVPKIKSLCELMSAFKSSASKEIHCAGFTDFKWHRSFHDHIIRNDSEYESISNYILCNPKNWKRDRYSK